MRFEKNQSPAWLARHAKKTNGHSEKFPRRLRLRGQRTFQAAFSSGRRMRCGGIALYLRKREDGREPRFGIVVSKRVNKLAARRNRIKRITKEFLRTKKKFLFGFDIVIRFHYAPCEKISSVSVCRELERVFDQAERVMRAA